MRPELGDRQLQKAPVAQLARAEISKVSSMQVQVLSGAPNFGEIIMVYGEHTQDYNCPKCGHDCCIGLAIIDSPTPIRDSSPCDAAIIKECPKCFCKFWHHIIREIIKEAPHLYNICNKEDFYNN